MDSPTSFRERPKPQERLLSPEKAKAQNESLARQNDRANRRFIVGFGPGSIPWRYVAPVGVGVFVLVLFPRLGMPFGRLLLIGALTALILLAVAFIQDVNRWLSR